VAPAAPHWVGDSDAYGTHAPLLVQQPAGHEVASQTHRPVAVSHSWPVAHAAHAAPPVPQTALVSDPQA
jgi:hypothetical protein